MDEDKKKKIMIGFIVACLVLAGIVFTATNRGRGGTGRSNKPIQILCTECEAEYELTADEFREQMQGKMSEGGMPMMMGPMAGPITLTCQECNEDAAVMAIKCPECEYVFVSGEAGLNDYPDRCPECDYSVIEERVKKSK